MIITALKFPKEIINALQVQACAGNGLRFSQTPNDG